MKLARLLSSGLVGLALSLAVTAGSIYVTVRAAAENSAHTLVSTESAAEVNSTAELQPAAHLTRTSAKSVGILDDVQLTADGSLTAKFSGLGTPSGELMSAAGLSVTLISVDGTATTVSTDVDGICEFPGLRPGLYTINATGPEGRLSYGIRAVPAASAVAQVDSDIEPLPVSITGSAVQLDFVLTPGRDTEGIDSVVSGVEVAPVERTSGSLPQGATMQTAYTTSGKSSAISDHGHGPLRLNADGSLKGQVTLYDPVTGNLATVKDLSVKFIADAEVVATTTVNPDGSFVQWNLLPGIYSMVVAGRDGIGYMGIEVVDELAQVNQPGRAIPTVLQDGDGAAIGIVQGAGESGEGDGEVAGDEESETDEGAQPFAGSEGGPGGGGPGGGGPGGEGGFGDLLGLAAAGLAAAALADDGGNGVASPAF